MRIVLVDSLDGLNEVLDEVLDEMIGFKQEQESVLDGEFAGEGTYATAGPVETTETARSEQEFTFAQLDEVEGLIGPQDLTSEEWREYQQADGSVYRVWHPVALYRREGGTTHRVVDSEGVVHCVPCGSLHPNVIIRWKNWDSSNPVNW